MFGYGNTFVERFYQGRPITEAVPATAPLDVPSPGSVERRDFNLKSTEAQRLFVWGMSENDTIPVNDFTVLSSTPFYGAMRYISEGIAMLGVKVKRREGDRLFDDISHPVSALFKRRPNPFMTWFDLMQAWVCNAMLGNGYIYVEWDRSTARPLQFIHIPSRYCVPEFDSNGFLWYRISGEINGRQVTKLVPHTDMLHLKGLSLDGLSGLKTSIIHKRAHGSSLNADQYTEKVFENGAFPSIAVKTDESLEGAEVKIMEDNLIRKIGGSRSAGRPLVLDKGQDVQYLQWSPIDVALEAVKHLSVEQVVQITKVPRDLLALDTHGTYGASMQRSKDLFVHCFQPWADKIVQEFNTKLFFDSEIALSLYFIELDSSLYLSMSDKERAEMYEIAIRSSQMTPNEVRSELKLDPKPDGDELYGNIDMLPLSAIIKVATAKYLSSEGEKSNAGQSLLTDTVTDDENETQPAQ